jgi:hypothetical protein
MLDEIGYDVLVYEDKELVIITKRTTLSLILDTVHYDLPYRSGDTEKYVLFSAVFNTFKSGKIRLGSIHAQFNVDYSESLPSIEKKYSEFPFIIGGDMNHPPDYQYYGLSVLNKDEATNFFTNYSSFNPYTIVELTDTRCNLPKAYDGFILFNRNKIISALIGGEHYWDKEVISGRESPVLKHVKQTFNKLF